MSAPDDTFKTGDGAPSHEYSVHLMAQIVSNSAQQAEGRVVGDAGFKSGNWPFPHEAGENLPLVRNRPGLTVSSLSAEHTVFDVDNDALGEPLELGERVGFPSLSPFLLSAAAFAAAVSSPSFREKREREVIVERCSIR